MLRSSLPLGRFLQVDLRLHLSFPLLLLLACTWSVLATGGALRGFALWLALCAAVLVREVARALAAAYAGLHLRALFLLPVGGIMAFANRDARSLDAAAPDTRWITASGPLANFAAGLVLLGLSYALDPHVTLFAQPWISLGHILRSFVWMQIVLGAVCLLPTPTMPSRELLRLRAGAPEATDAVPARAGSGPVFNFGTGVALALIVAGLVMFNFFFLTVLGVCLLLAAQISSIQTRSVADTGSILVREVMLTDYPLLSSSDTLRNALDRTVHSLNDAFPVVRGNRLVGSIGRHAIAERLLAEGDGYLQGVMRRSLSLASPTEPLVEALNRAPSLGPGEFIPVVEDDGHQLNLIGILTLQSLGRAVQQVKLVRPPQPSRNQAS